MIYTHFLKEYSIVMQRTLNLTIRKQTCRHPYVKNKSVILIIRFFLRKFRAREAAQHGEKRIVVTESHLNI